MLLVISVFPLQPLFPFSHSCFLTQFLAPHWTSIPARGSLGIPYPGLPPTFPRRTSPPPPAQALLPRSHPSTQPSDRSLSPLNSCPPFPTALTSWPYEWLLPPEEALLQGRRGSPRSPVPGRWGGWGSRPPDSAPHSAASPPRRTPAAGAHYLAACLPPPIPPKQMQRLNIPQVPAEAFCAGAELTNKQDMAVPSAPLPAAHAQQPNPAAPPPL